MLPYTRAWLKNYKIPDGKPENVFAFEGEYKNKAFALQIIQETRQAWKDLIVGGKISYESIQKPHQTSQLTTITLNADQLVIKNIQEGDADVTGSYYGLMTNL